MASLDDTRTVEIGKPMREGRRRRKGGIADWPSVSELEFTGCVTRRMTLAEYEDTEERVEFYDSESEVCWMMREPIGFGHEAAAMALVELVRVVALMRGSAIKCLGSGELRLVDAERRRIRGMQPDQMVFLHPELLDAMDHDYLSVEDELRPDVVLEVDHTTDVRRGKLRLYESWGFPELWVAVPDRGVAKRPKSRRPGVTIHVLEDGRYRESRESRAFPGWTGIEIHRGLNEPTPSEETIAVLDRVGRTLGGSEGTGPDDDPLLRRIHEQGHASGRTEGRAEVTESTAREVLTQRGIAVSAAFPADRSQDDRAALLHSSVAAVVRAASSAETVADFFARLR